MTHPTLQQLEQWLFAQEQLTTSETRFIFSHLECCSHCSTYIKSLQAFHAHLLLHLEGLPSVRDQAIAKEIQGTAKYASRIRFVYKIAAVIACAALAAVGYYLIFSESHPRQNAGQVLTQKKPNNSSSQTIPLMDQSIAGNFTPSQHLDDLVQTQFRSGSIDVTAPTINETVSMPITFRWGGTNQPLMLNILTNKEKKIFSIPVSTTFYVLQKQLQPGLYYWKLENEDELLFIGKFIVRK